jgi:hypothetical protein
VSYPPSCLRRGVEGRREKRSRRAGNPLPLPHITYTLPSYISKRSHQAMRQSDEVQISKEAIAFTGRVLGPNKEKRQKKPSSSQLKNIKIHNTTRLCTQVKVETTTQRTPQTYNVLYTIFTSLYHHPPGQSSTGQT